MFRSLDKAEKEKERMESDRNEEDGHEDKREGTGDYNSSPQTPDNDAAPIKTVRQRYTRLQLTSFAQSNDLLKNSGYNEHYSISTSMLAVKTTPI